MLRSWRGWFRTVSAGYQNCDQGRSQCKRKNASPDSISGTCALGRTITPELADSGFEALIRHSTKKGSVGNLCSSNNARGELMLVASFCLLVVSPTIDVMITAKNGLVYASKSHSSWARFIWVDSRRNPVHHRHTARRGRCQPASSHPFRSLQVGAPVQEVHRRRHEAVIRLGRRVPRGRIKPRGNANRRPSKLPVSRFIAQAPVTVRTLPLFIPLILDSLQASPSLETLSIENCCILPNSQYACNVAPLPHLRWLRATSDAVSKILHLIDIPSSANIEIGSIFWMEPRLSLYSSMPMSCLSRWGIATVKLLPSM